MPLARGAIASWSAELMTSAATAASRRARWGANSTIRRRRVARDGFVGLWRWALGIQNRRRTDPRRIVESLLRSHRDSVEFEDEDEFEFDCCLSEKVPHTQRHGEHQRDGSGAGHREVLGADEPRRPAVAVHQQPVDLD